MGSVSLVEQERGREGEAGDQGWRRGREDEVEGALEPSPVALKRKMEM